MARYLDHYAGVSDEQYFHLLKIMAINALFHIEPAHVIDVDPYD